MIEQMTDEEFERRTLGVIQREFGVGGVARFIMTCHSARGNYTAERHEWVDRPTVQDAAKEEFCKVEGEKDAFSILTRHF